MADAPPVSLRVIKNLSLADQVFEQVAAEILSGRTPPGQHLPPERRLVETFKVNRHVVREALKRLEQIGLVSVSQGGGTKVSDFRRTAGLDLLALMAEYSQATGDDVLRNWLAVHEMRAAIAPDAARLCAIRASAELKKEIVEIARQMATVGDGSELFALELRFWDKVIDGAENVAYRLCFNTLVKGGTAPRTVELAERWGIHEVKQAAFRVPLALALAAGNAADAERMTRESMRLVVGVLGEQLGVNTGVAPGGDRAPAARRSK